MAAAPIFSSSRKNPTSDAPWLTVRNEASAATAEILIHGQIGKDWWSDDGVSEKEFIDALKLIPSDREITVGINSEGGEIKAGLGIYNALQQRRDRVTVRIDGYAVSIASIIALAGKRTISPKSSIWMIHEPWTYAQGNAADFTAAAEMLDQHAEMLVDIYAEHTGKSRDEIRAAMQKETWLRGTEAVEFGLCDECTDDPANLALKNSFDITKLKNAPDYVKNLAAGNGAPAKPQTLPTAARSEAHNKKSLMDKEEIIAALKARGDSVDENATTEQLKAQLLAAPKAKAQPKQEPKPEANAELKDDGVKALASELAAIRAERKVESEKRIKAEITALANEGRIPLNSVDNWTKLAVANEADVMAQLKALPVNEPGIHPVSGFLVKDSIEPGDGADIKDVTKFIVANSDGRTKKFIGANAGNFRRLDKPELKFLHEGMVNSYNTIKKHSKMLHDVMNANTIDTALQRNVILTNSILREFEIPMLKLSQFCTVHEQVPLEGTNKVEVPYLGLQGAGESKSFSGTYTLTGTSAIGVREILVGGDGDSTTSGDNSAAGNYKDRIYQDISFTSYETSRQPWLLLDRIFGMKGERLALDIFKNIVSKVIVAANYGTAMTRSATAFSSDDIATLRGIATKASWPTARQITFETDYMTSLLKDPAFKAVYAAGTDETLRRAEIKKAYGFDDINEVPNLDTYMSGNAAGWITAYDALLIATANIIPNEKVRSQLSAFNIVGNPQTGISFAYRAWGAATTDTGAEIIECSIGAAKGRESGLQLLKKQ